MLMNLSRQVQAVAAATPARQGIPALSEPVITYSSRTGVHGHHNGSHTHTVTSDVDHLDFQVVNISVDSGVDGRRAVSERKSVSTPHFDYVTVSGQHFGHPNGSWDAADGHAERYAIAEEGGSMAASGCPVAARGVCRAVDGCAVGSADRCVTKGPGNCSDLSELHARIDFLELQMRLQRLQVVEREGVAVGWRGIDRQTARDTKRQTARRRFTRTSEFCHSPGARKASPLLASVFSRCNFSYTLNP
jgi:hypothetical protein